MRYPFPLFSFIIPAKDFEYVNNLLPWASEILTHTFVIYFISVTKCWLASFRFCRLCFGQTVLKSKVYSRRQVTYMTELSNFFYSHDEMTMLSQGLIDVFPACAYI